MRSIGRFHRLLRNFDGGPAAPSCSPHRPASPARFGEGDCFWLRRPRVEKRPARLIRAGRSAIKSNSRQRQGGAGAPPRALIRYSSNCWRAANMTRLADLLSRSKKA